VSQSIGMASGWNMISSYVAPDNPDMSAVFSEIVSDVVLVKNGTGQVYWPDFGINGIGSWNVLHGYQVYLINPRILEISGIKVAPELSPMALPQGWNLIAYLRDAPYPIDQALASINSELLLAKNNTGQVYWPAFGINGIGNMQPGQAYQVYMNSSGTLTYPGSSLLNLNEIQSAPKDLSESTLDSETPP
jgi:hypothetical protein